MMTKFLFAEDAFKKKWYKETTKLDQIIYVESDTPKLNRTKN